MVSQPLDSLPIWALYPVTVALLLLAVAFGNWYVGRKQRKSPGKSDAGVGAISAATLALLAFLLAFVVGYGTSLFTERRTLLVSEANAISTTYLRAGYLDEPYRTESRDLLSDYVDQRVAALDRANVESAIVRSEEIHRELWQIVEDMVQGGGTSATTAQYISALNEVIDLHAERVAVNLQVRMPAALPFALLLIAVGAMVLIGMQVAYTDNRNLTALVTLALVLAVVFYLIADLDRASQGLLQVPNQTLIDLQDQLPTLP